MSRCVGLLALSTPSLRLAVPQRVACSVATGIKCAHILSSPKERPQTSSERGPPTNLVAVQKTRQSWPPKRKRICSRCSFYVAPVKGTPKSEAACIVSAYKVHGAAFSNQPANGDGKGDNKRCELLSFVMFYVTHRAHTFRASTAKYQFGAGRVSAGRIVTCSEILERNAQSPISLQPMPADSADRVTMKLHLNAPHAHI